MSSVVAAFVLAILVAAIATPFVRRLALRSGAVDEPGARRVHTRRVPRLGGIAIVIGFFLPLVTLFGLQTHAARIFFSRGSITAGFVAGSGFLKSWAPGSSTTSKAWAPRRSYFFKRRPP